MQKITVMGAGVFGLSIGFALAQRGARVTVLDKRGVGAGSSGGPVGALSPHTPENWNPKKQFQLESLLMAQRFWANAAEISGRPTGYGRIGRLQPIADARALELARARIAGALQHWQGQAIWEVVERPGAWSPVSATGLWVRDTLSARIDPARACDALARAITRLGGSTETGDAPPDAQVIWCTGYEGLVDLSNQLGKPVGNGVKGQALSLRYDAGTAPQLFADALHIVPHADGTVAIGSTSERAFVDPDAPDAQIDALHAKALRICPLLEGAPVSRRWAGVRPRAKSRAPMLGAWPDRPGHFIANGGFKIGFGMAPKIAEVMAELILEGRDKIPEGFRVADNL